MCPLPNAAGRLANISSLLFCIPPAPTPAPVYSMSLWISLHLPFHSLDAAFPYWHIEQPVAAVIDQEKVCALTPAARQAGILPGMRQGTAQAQVPQITLRHRNLGAEAKGLQQAVLCLLQYTPEITLLDTHSLAMDVTASLDLFGGPRALWRKIRLALQGLNLNVQLAMAPTPQGAWALALQNKTRRRRALKLVTLAGRLDSLPANCLPALLPWLEWLQGLGCNTLGQLRRLPRQGLQQRTQPKVMQALDAAYGLHAVPHIWVTPPEIFERRYDTLQRLEHSNAILNVARKLIEQLCGWLQAGHRSTSRLIFMLHHEKGRHARPPTLLELALSEAGWSPDDFLPALTERLNRLVLAAHVIAVELVVDQTQTRAVRSQGLFPEPAQWAHQESRLLDLLRSRLGENRILRAQPVADHLPESANIWVAHNLPGSKQGDPILPLLQEHARPFWLLDPPLPLLTERDTPIYQGHRLRLLKGPERIESGWWSSQGQQQRDYFIAQDAQQARYWIFRQRAALDACWFLHGLFG